MKLPDHFEALGARVALLSDAGYPDYAAFGVLALAALLLCVFTGRRLVERGVARRIEDLRLSQEQFRQLTDNIQEVFWLIDTARQTMLYISPNYERVWGRTCASLYASREPWPDAVHPGDLARVRQFVTTSKSSGTYDEEFRIARPDGSIRWIRERAFPVRDATGAVYRIAGVAEDITDRKLTDTALKASETRFRSMLEGLEAGVVVHSADSRVTAFNAKATELLGVSAAQERRQQATAIYAQFGEAISWVEPELLTVGQEKTMGFVAAEPGLKNFRFQLTDLFRRSTHILSPEAEKVLAASVDPLSGISDIRSQLVLTDIPWPEVELAQGKVRLDNQGYVVARQSPIREERKKVFDAVFGTYKTYEGSLGANLAAQVRSDIFVAKSRNYGSALEAALAPANIPTGVYRTLVAEANRGLPVLHRYFEMRRRLLGLPDMHYYDIYPPTTKLDRKFGLAETRELTLKGLAPLGKPYVDELARATSARWMHAYPQKGKRSGAYVNGSAYDVHPYVLLNHSDDYEGLTTYAHEWGHAMHSVMANKAQPFETANYPTFTAEIASTLNELLLADYMLPLAKTKAEKLYYLDKLCETFRGTFYRQTMFAEFELAIHETAEKGEALSGERLSAIYLDLLKKYHGPKVVIDPAYATEWAYIQHFYFNFYVFQYATSVTAATYFHEQIRTRGAKAVDAYLGVLKTGGADYPVDVLKRAGADMTGPAPYQALIARFGKTLDQMEALMA